MKVYIFGNEDLEIDNSAFKVEARLKGKIKNIEFVKVLPNEDLPFAESKEEIVIIDTIDGIDKITQFTDLDKFSLPPRSTVHDFDLSFQLKYLKKMGKIRKVTVIGIPIGERNIDYFLIQSILRKLVAQDMHGS